MSLPKITLKKWHVVVIAVAVVAFLGWRIASSILSKPADERVAPVVRTMTVGASATNDTVTYPGEVRGKYESKLAFQVAGKIIRRDVNLGDRVSAGQVLMEIDPKDVIEKVRAAEAAYTAADTQARLASDNYARYESLHSQGAVSTMVRDQYRTQYEASAATLNQAAANLTAAENQMSYTTLVADHDGSIASISGEVGQVVAAGSPVVTMVQDEGREIEIHVPENHIGSIYPGENAKVTFWALSNVTAMGRVTDISSMADSVTRTYTVRVAVDDFPAAARLGMTAKVEFKGKGSMGILLPQSAIYQRGDKPKVWVVTDGKVHLKEVVTAGYDGDNVKITSGLSDGDVVVTGGINQLSEGEDVRMEGSVFK